jgi:hypothetical protein
LPAETQKSVPPEALEWAARVWKRLQVFECAGVLYMALRYDQREPRTAEYVEMMAMLPWLGLGDPLQRDIARALLSLRDTFGKGF